MPRTNDGRPRYARRRPAAGPRMVVDGQDLGPAILPQRLFAALRRILELDDEHLLGAFAAAAARIEDGDDTMLFGALSDDDFARIVSQAGDVSKSRLRAWRDSQRQMTWWEMYALLIGLLETRDEYVATDQSEG